MNKYLKRLIYVDSSETQKINPLLYPPLLATLVYGSGVVFFGWWDGVALSSLYQAMSGMYPWLPQIWGLFAMVSAASAAVLLLIRRGWWGETAAMTGFLSWMFALFVYMTGGYWLVVITVTLPNLYFWTYYYLSVKEFMRRKSNGLVRDPM